MMKLVNIRHLKCRVRKGLSVRFRLGALSIHRSSSDGRASGLIITRTQVQILSTMGIPTRS